MNKPKVLLLHNTLAHYRLPIWNLLAQKCDLTVTFSFGKTIDTSKYDFKVIYLPTYKIWKFILQKINIRKFARQYDLVIAYGADLKWLKFNMLPLFNKQKVIFWSLGVSASYTRHFDDYKKYDLIKKFIYNQADALIFYTDYPIHKYEKMGISTNKMFVAPNTVEVYPLKEKKTKDTILFIGTLYQQKGIQFLLDSYLKLKEKYLLPILKIIGEGPEFENISKWISENEMGDLIKLCGAVYDSHKKAQFFAEALACVSPTQAGLSVLESMGHGVPFITTKNAFTGGEIFNIHNGIDGVVMDDICQLTSIIRDIAKNPIKYVKMGEHAQEFYNSNRLPMHMVEGAWKAICYALNNTSKSLK